jgi:TP901 family phage tail tape measure protein
MTQVAGSVEVAVRANMQLFLRDLERARMELQKFSSTATRATAGTAKQFDAMGSASSRASGAIAAFTRQFAFLGTLTAGFALYKVSDQFASFEYNMNTVRAVLNTTGSEFALLNTKAQELGSTTRYSADQVAEAMTLMAKAGMSAGQVYGGVASTLQLAAVEGLDLATSTEAVVNIMTGMGLSVKDLDRAVNVLTKTSIDSTTGVTELAYAFKYASGISETAGVSLEEVAAAMGLMAQAGTKGSTAGTALRGIITRLVGPTEEARKVMKAWGISVVDASGKFKPLSDVIRQFEPMAKAGARGLEDMFTVFGARPFQGIAALTKAGADEFDKFTKNLQNTGDVAKRVSEIQMEGLKGAMLQLGTAASGLAVAIGESGLGKAFEYLADKATSALNAMTAALKGMAPLQEQSAAVLRNTLSSQQAELDQVDRAIERLRTNRAGAGQIAALEAGRKKMVENMATTHEFLMQQQQVQTALKAPAAKVKEQLDDVTPPAAVDIEGGLAKRKAAQEALQRLESEYLESTKQNKRLIEVEQERELAKFKELLDKKLISQTEYENAVRQLGEVTQKKMEELRQKDLKFIEDITGAISSGLEGAFRSFIETGKVDFNELTRSILADIAVIALRMAVLQPLFGGGQTQGGGAIGSMIASLFHTGGVAGSGSGVKREMPMAAFFGAPRMHKGGQILGANEVPAILNRGERVVPAGANDNGRVTVQIINNSSAQVKEDSTRSSDGEEIRRFVIEETNKGMTRGAFDGSMRGRYGNQVVGTRR